MNGYVETDELAEMLEDLEYDEWVAVGVPPSSSSSTFPP